MPVDPVSKEQEPASDSGGWFVTGLGQRALEGQGTSWKEASSLGESSPLQGAEFSHLSHS